MPETTEIRELTRKRGGVNHKLTNFVKHVVPIYNKFKINPSLDDEVIIELQNRLDKLEIIYNGFEGIQLEIESLSPDNVLEGHYKERDEFTDKYNKYYAITKKMLNAKFRNLELDEIPVHISINGVSNVIANVRSKCNVRLASMHNNFNLKLSCYVLPTITGCLPNVEVNISDWKLPNNVSLADPKFNIPKQIDLLIGASHFLENLQGWNNSFRKRNAYSDSESETSPFELVKLLNKGSNSPSRSVSSRRAIFTPTTPPITAAWSKHDQMPVHPSIAAISSGIGDFIKDMDNPEPSDLLRKWVSADKSGYMWKLQVFTGKSVESRDNRLGTHVKNLNKG
ncbi:hypothetical protein ILUMI_13545 [Ignelater luminosus]|uniref:Uncharacterized protein n=1 Tax=Ignelater luminosus TaxID=2038154 RepID=A0A8K0CYC3_IGNLU|nr:hypothetical protein ILUMI_13545 [Ignelater luminosus]